MASGRPLRPVTTRVAPPGADSRVTAEQRARFVVELGELFAALGLPLDTPGTRGTPERFFDALVDLTRGYAGDPKLDTSFPAEREATERGGAHQVVEGPIPFAAVCEHHALPFVGAAFVGYVPADRLVGLSKMTRIVRVYARRFTLQERIGREVASTLEALVRPSGVAVHLEAMHLCTAARGVCEPDARTRTSTWRGTYEDRAELRSEFLSLCERSR